MSSAVSSAVLSSQQLRLAYFGKLPAYADFVKASGHAAMITLLDGWLVEVMDRLSADPRWKLDYDAMKPLDFVFLGTRQRYAIAGQLIASMDSSARRFPFLCASLIEVRDPASFLPLSPLILAPLWERLTPLLCAVGKESDPAAFLQQMAASSVAIAMPADQPERGFADFVEQHSLAILEELLASQQVRQLILALGLLLQPVRSSAAERLDKSLVLPLPQALAKRAAVAAFWLTLVKPFILAADFELLLFVGQQRGKCVLVLSFAGAMPDTLLAMIAPQYAAEQQIRLEYADWVEELLAGDAEAQKLSAYLDQGQLSLRSVIALFQETFR